MAHILHGGDSWGTFSVRALLNKLYLGRMS
jgi:hypothetical protein